MTTATETAPGADRDRTRTILVVVAVVLAVAAVGLSVLLVTGDDAPAAAAVTFEAADRAGEDPFTESVAVAPVTTFPDEVEAVGAAIRDDLQPAPGATVLVATGTTPGLYGGTGDGRACDPAKLIGFLDANPAKAAAWASVLGIEPDTISSYVAGLTPVVLASDTLVDNHGFRDGTATTKTSVLQAGTAVMIDVTGTPRVKCNCGNPLTPPRVLTVPAAGASGAWSGYSPDAVTTVEPGRAGRTFTLVDLTTGATFDQPAGTAPSGGPATTTTSVPEPDGSTGWVATFNNHPNGDGGPPGDDVVSTSTDGATWTEVGRIEGMGTTALAYGDGAWLAAATRWNGEDPDVGSRILRSTDLATWTELTTLPDKVLGLAHGDGQWVAVGARASAVVAYTSPDGRSWEQAGGLTAPIGAGPSMDAAVAFGDGLWLASFGPADGSSSGLYRSDDGRSWSLVGNFSAASGGALTYGDGRWSRWVSLGPGNPVSGRIETSTDGGRTWTPGATVSRPSQYDDDRLASDALAADGGRTLASTWDGGIGVDLYVVDADGATEGPTAQGEEIFAIAAGPIG